MKTAGKYPSPWGGVKAGRIPGKDGLDLQQSDLVGDIHSRGKGIGTKVSSNPNLSFFWKCRRYHYLLSLCGFKLGLFCIHNLAAATEVMARR